MVTMDVMRQIQFGTPGALYKAEIKGAMLLAIKEAMFTQDESAVLRAVAAMVDNCAKAGVDAVELMKECLL